mmetsp:Transcript_52116/g.122151  ORF Transcript_52116/g.122151 Transcript_52116/m.122151 type:complete len:125 (+) Transcript_52116:10-384(+)
MNAPERHELTFLPEHLSKLSISADTKIVNAANFKIEREDHTLGNLLRMQLLSDPDVIFAGYRVPHPLDKHIMVKVQTKRETKPHQALAKAVDALKEEIGSLETKFGQALALHKQMEASGGLDFS